MEVQEGVGLENARGLKLGDWDAGRLPREQVADAVAAEEGGEDKATGRVVLAEEGVSGPLERDYSPHRPGAS